MKKKIILVLFILLFCKTKAYALSYGGCDVNDVARMKQLVNNVNISYNYRIVNNEALFDVTLSNVTWDMYVHNSYTNRVYYTNPSGEIIIYGIKDKKDSFRFYSNRNECRGILLGTKYLTFPIYNKFFTNDICKDMIGFSYCNKWVPKEYTYSEVESAIKKYKESIDDDSKPTKEIHNKTFWESLLDFYVNYYIIVLLAIIVTGIIIIYTYNKKSQFKI